MKDEKAPNTPNDGNNELSNIMKGAPPVDPIENPLWEIDERFLNPLQDLPERPTFATMGERKALPVQGIVTFSAKPKQGKSTAIRALLIPLLSGRAFDTLKPTEHRPRLVIVFDTEMNEPDLLERTKATRAALGENANRYQVISLLATPKSERLATIEEITNLFRPDIVVIDQAAMLVKDFNSSEEGQDIRDRLLQFAQTRAVWVVIHQNKAADNSQMKGHLGSMLDEAAVENYGVSTKGGVFEVKPLNARSSYVDEETPGVKFSVEEGGVITTADAIENARNEKERAKWYQDFARIFGADLELSYKELSERIKAQGLSNTGIDNKIEKAKSKEIGVIFKTGTGRAPYRLIMPPGIEPNATNETT